MGPDRRLGDQRAERVLIVAWLLVAVTVAGLAAALIGELRDLTLWFVAKPIASTGFLGLALTLGATETPYGRWILVALVFGWIGDVALMGSARSWFLTGLAAYLIGHLLYVFAFFEAGLAAGPAVMAAVVATVTAVVVFRWLRLHVPSEMVGPVVAYVVIISAMLVAAVGATAAGATALILLGAFAFCISDLAVARDRFVSPSFANRIWGLPLYYLGQMLLAWSVA
jgi:uncharacterized membrane protein YhhN